MFQSHRRAALFSMFLFLGILGLLFTGCEVDGGGDFFGDASSTSNDQQDTAGSSSNNSSGGSSGYFFVRIDDLSTHTTNDTPGADIDGVKLVKGGVDYFPRGVEDYAPGVNASGIDGGALDATNALFIDSVSADGTTCSIDTSTFVSLGGVGGHLILNFTEEIETGDQLFVYEVGGCNFGGGVAKPDPLKVSVSVSADPDGTWVQIFQSNSEGQTIVGGAVPSLPTI